MDELREKFPWHLFCPHGSVGQHTTPEGVCGHTVAQMQERFDEWDSAHPVEALARCVAWAERYPQYAIPERIQWLRELVTPITAPEAEHGTGN